jgi:predicted RNA binding protein YcfA (HicA-like mRNA interferase family)
MSQKEKRLVKLMQAGNEKSFSFEDFISAINTAGYIYHHSTGSHQFFTHSKLRTLTLQPDRNGKAKPYQIRQARDEIAKLKQYQS